MKKEILTRLIARWTDSVANLDSKPFIRLLDDVRNKCFLKLRNSTKKTFSRGKAITQDEVVFTPVQERSNTHCSPLDGWAWARVSRSFLQVTQSRCWPLQKVISHSADVDDFHWWRRRSSVQYFGPNLKPLNRTCKFCPRFKFFANLFGPWTDVDKINNICDRPDQNWFETHRDGQRNILDTLANNFIFLDRDCDGSGIFVWWLYFSSGYF